MTTLAGPLLREAYRVLSERIEPPVFDYVPEQQSKPYVVLGEVSETQDDSHDRTGSDAVLTVHVWSEQRGYRETAHIIGAVSEALHRRPMTLPGFRDVSVAATGNQYTRDPDPRLRHGVVRFRVWATEAPDASTEPDEQASTDPMTDQQHDTPED